jgi:hypothetical protein
MGMEGNARKASAADASRNVKAVTSGFASAIVHKPGNSCEAPSLDMGDAKYANDRRRTADK